MRALILSDLHLEFGHFDPVHNGRLIGDGADVVILAGDIAEGTRGIHWARRTFEDKEIVYITGNHEFYDLHFEETLQALRDAAAQEGVHFLERDKVQFGPTTILGATLWTDFRLFGQANQEGAIVEAQHYMNDFKTITTSYGLEKPFARRPFAPQDTLRMHFETVYWLQDQLKGADPQRTVVITHHAPHLRSSHLRYVNDPLTPAFASDLGHLLGRSRYWVHGHMHNSSRYVVNGTQVIANPRGYRRRDGSIENEMFDPTLQIEI